MPLSSRLALAAGLLTATAVGVTALLGSFANRRELDERTRAGAEGVAEVVARAAALTGEFPVRLEAEIGEQMVTQGRLLAHLVAVAEQAGVPRADVDARLRQIAGLSPVELLATDATGAVVVTSDPQLQSFAFSPDPTEQPREHAYHRLLGGDLPSIVQDAARAEGGGKVMKWAGVPGVDGPRIVRVGVPADFLDRADRVAGLRRLAADVVTGEVREMRVVDARATPVVSRIADGRGNSSDALTPLEAADAMIVRECIISGRVTGRAAGETYRAAAPLRRVDGLPGGAVIVALGSVQRAAPWARETLAALASALLVGIPSLLAAAWLGRTVTLPMAVSTDLLDRAASGDLSGPAPAGGTDEGGRLVTAAGRAASSMREALRRVREAVTRLSADETDVSASLARQDRAVRGFHGSAHDVAGGITMIASNADHLLEATTNLTGAAREATRVADEGREGLDAMSESMRQLDDAMTVFTRKLATIRQRASGITAVVTTIAKVADQTNLLSVNATIEAEKAGEAGRGFRIVAQEIRRLADQTALATKDIERMVRDMQSAVSSGTMEMDRFRNEVSDRIQRVAEVGERLTRIVAPVQAVTDSLEQLREGMESQASSTRQVRDAMDRLRGGAEQSAFTSESFAAAVDRFRTAIGDLNDEVARFRIEPTSTAAPAE